LEVIVAALADILGERDPDRLNAALRFVLRRYAAQLRNKPALAIGALLLPALGDILTLYAPPLMIARLLGAFARNEQLSAARLTPYVLAFAGMWLAGQVCWRIAGALIARVEIRSMEALYVEALDELLVKDLAFFQNNYAGSLTKRALGYARRFEDVFDSLAFQIASTGFPLVFVAVVLWAYSPWLIVALLGMLTATFLMVFPLIRRRRQLVDLRESASNVLAGHVADSITNAEAVRTNTSPRKMLTASSSCEPAV
jgi:ATP-binding cassette, subfamily B, bacterial